METGWSSRESWAFRYFIVQGLPHRGHRNDGGGALLKPHARLRNLNATVRLMIPSDPIFSEHIHAIAAVEDHRKRQERLCLHYSAGLNWRFWISCVWLYGVFESTT